MGIYFLTAIALFLVLEGLLPFAAPHIWRNMMRQLSMFPDKTLRLFGLISMLIGLLILYLVHHQ